MACSSNILDNFSRALLFKPMQVLF